jgi:hypothetical protein
MQVPGLGARASPRNRNLEQNRHKYAGPGLLGGDQRPGAPRGMRSVNIRCNKKNPIFINMPDGIGRDERNKVDLSPEGDGSKIPR